MKNIHILPTDKPSRLFKDDNQVLTLNTHPVLKGIFTNGIGSNQHIYITNDKEIKEGDWCINLVTKTIVLCSENFSYYGDWKKIILTDNKDLIKDGVQAIDDTFLKWFVRNLNCESIEVCKNPFYEESNYEHYKIIILKKEDKQVWEQIIETCGGKEAFIESAGLKPKQETLEEAAVDYISEKSERAREYGMVFNAIRFGAKWQADRMYSEEEVRTAIFKSFLLGVDRNFYSKEIEDKIIQQLKKK